MLARVDFSPAEPAPDPPVGPESCVLVSVPDRSGFADVYAVGVEATLEPPEATA